MTTPDPAAPVAGTERDALADLTAEIHLWQGDASTPVDLAVLRRAAAEIARLRAEVEELPRDTSLPWPCTCGRTDTNGCDRCDPRDARIAELEAALREVMETLTVPAAEYVPAIPDAWGVIRRALGDAHG